MHDKKVFTGCMIRHGGLLAAEAILALAVSVILVQGNKIISGVIDEMLSGRQVLFGSFLLQFLIYTVVGTIAAFLQSAAANRYAVAVCTEYRDLVGRSCTARNINILMPIILLPYSIKSSEIWERSPVFWRRCCRI